MQNVYIIIQNGTANVNITTALIKGRQDGLPHQKTHYATIGDVSIFNGEYSDEDIAFFEAQSWAYVIGNYLSAGKAEQKVYDHGFTFAKAIQSPPASEDIPATKLLVSNTAKGSKIFNTASYADSYLITHNGYQYITFNDLNLNVMVGKREIGSSTWSIVDTGFNTLANDDHNISVLGIDVNGYIHLSYDHHGNTLNYARSNSPENITAFTKRSMIGTNEASVTYPKFFNANGFLFFSYRDGGSMSGDEYLNKWDGETWVRVAKLVDGISYGYGTYPDSYAVDANGRIHHAFCWRVDDNPAILYENYTYMYSDDNGATWFNSQGTQYTLPVTPDQAGDIISGNISLFWPQNHIAIDSQNRPHIAYGKASNTILRDNYFHTYLDNGVWQHTQITNYAVTINALGTFFNYKFSRPSIVIDKATNKVFIIGRVLEGDFLRLFTSVPPYEIFTDFRVGDPPETWGRMEMGGIDKQLWNTSKIFNITADAGYASNPDSLYVLQVELP